MNEIAGSHVRFPDFQVLIWNPNETTIADVARGVPAVPARDISLFVESFSFTENIGYESGESPQVTTCGFNLRRNPNTLLDLRRGLIEDGVIVQLLEGDKRIAKSDWVTTFTGIFRGGPGDNPGIRQTLQEGLTAVAFGREERFINHKTTTEKMPDDATLEADPSFRVDLGEIINNIATKHMGLTQDEILIGLQGFESQHLVNQIVDLPSLQAIYECLFPVGKKPKFDGQGRLAAVSVDLDKPAVRVYPRNDLIQSIVRQPNDGDVMTRVILTGLGAVKTRMGPDTRKFIVEVENTVGFFDFEYRETVWFSDDRTLTADGTILDIRTNHTFPPGVTWMYFDWDQDNAGHGEHKRGVLKVHTVYIVIIYYYLIVIYFVLKLAYSVALSAGQTTGAAVLDFAAALILIAIVGAMQYIGRFKVQVWGFPYEYIFQELKSQAELEGLDPEEHRTRTYRNDFLSDIDTLDTRARAMLRRELVKDQTYAITMLNDPFLEVDDIIETAPEPGFTQGDRYYITSIKKQGQRDAPPLMSVSAWLVSRGSVAEQIEALENAGAPAP